MGSRLTRSITRANATTAQETAPDPDQLDLGIRTEQPRQRMTASAEGDGTRWCLQGGDAQTVRPRLTVLGIALLGALALTAAPAWAAGGGATMPWDGPLQALVNNLTGTTARALVTVAVVGAGLLWAFTRNEEGLKKLGQIAFGGAIALGAATLMANLGFAGATF